jgi:hypothetical protein
MHCTVIGPNLHTSKIVTAISVSERLLEMAAFYIPIYAAEGDSAMKLLTSGFSGNEDFVAYLNEKIAEMQEQGLIDQYVAEAQTLAGIE